MHANYKNAIVAAPLGGTIITDNPPRARASGLRTPAPASACREAA